MNKIEKTLNLFLGEEETPENEKKVCDSQTGECYTIKTKDGIIERVNKQFITEDGRLLLGD